MVQNETKISDNVNNTITPSVNLPKDKSSNENRDSSQNNTLDSKGANDKKEPKLSKSKKKKKNARKGKNKDSVAALQNEVKDEIKTHDSEPEKSSEQEIDSEKEEHKSPKTEVLLDQSSTMATQEGHETNPTIAQRRVSISKDDARNTEASETKISEAADLGTKTSTIEDVSTITVPENKSTSLSNTIPMVLESKPPNTPPNPDGSSEISYGNPSSANDEKQDKFNVQESSESIKESKELPELKNPHLIASPTNELVKENAVLESQALTNNLISETGDFKAASDSLMAETAPISLKEDDAASTSLESESRPLAQEKASSETLRDVAINIKTSKATEKNENSITSLFETGLEATSKFLMNLEDKIVKDVEPNLSLTSLGTDLGKLIKGSSFQEPELSSSSQLEELDMKTQAEQQTSSKTSDDNNETGTTLQNLDEQVDVASELQNLDTEIQITSSNNLFESNASVNAEITEVRDLSDNTVATSEHVISEKPSVFDVTRHIVQPEVLRSEPSVVLDGNIINDKEVDMTEPSALAEEITTSITSLTDFINSNEETEVNKTNTKEIIDAIGHSFETDESNVTEGEIIGSGENEVSEPIGDISANEEILIIQSDCIESVQDEPSCLCTNSKTLTEQDKELTPAVLKNASDTEERSTGPQDHAETTTKEPCQPESWKNSSESTAGEAKSLVDDKVSQTSDQVRILRHSNYEIPNSEIVNTTPPESKNDETHGQKLAQYPETEEKCAEKILSNISNPKEKSDSEVDLVEVKSDGEVSAISPKNDVFGSSASVAEITNKTKLKFKPSVGEQALAPELVTISKETLDLLYKRLDSMQLEIERLSLALNSQNKTTPAPHQDNSNNSLNDDHMIIESSQQNSRITEEEETVNTRTMKQLSKNKSITKSSCLLRLMSIFGYKTITKSDAGLVTRSVSENLLSPSRGSKGKGREIIAQPNKPSTARTYKVVGRVRAKHDLS